MASPHVATSTPFGVQVDRILDQAVASQRIVGAVVQIASAGEVVYQRAAGSPQSAGTWFWSGVYGHRWYVDPMRKLTVVALTNTAPEGHEGQFTIDLRNAVYSGSTPIPDALGPTS